jgi:ssDNA thymidine ADP-ribosyltransferase DarT-like protein
MVAGKMGVLATRRLSSDERNVYAPTDLQRLDGFTDHICCSVEYPNSWYFERARSTDVLFKDWVVLLIDPKYLSDSRTLFSPRNASAEFGRRVMPGYEGFSRLFADKVDGAYGKTFTRSASRRLCCPTDEQAEVLVPDVIELKDVQGVVVSSKEQAVNEIVRLRLLQIPSEEIKSLRFLVVPEFWDKYQLSGMIRDGRRPVENEVHAV